MKPGVNVQAGLPLRLVAPGTSAGASRCRCIKTRRSRWHALACCGCSASPSRFCCSCGQWGGCT